MERQVHVYSHSTGPTRVTETLVMALVAVRGLGYRNSSWMTVKTNEYKDVREMTD